MRMDRGNPCSISESLERIFIGTRALNLSPHIAEIGIASSLGTQ